MINSHHDSPKKGLYLLIVFPDQSDRARAWWDGFNSGCYLGMAAGAIGALLVRLAIYLVSGT